MKHIAPLDFSERAEPATAAPNPDKTAPANTAEWAAAYHKAYPKSARVGADGEWYSVDVPAPKRKKPETAAAAPVKEETPEERRDRNISRYPKDGRLTLYDRLKKGMLLVAVRRDEFVGVWEVQTKHTFKPAFLPPNADLKTRVRLGAFNPVGVSNDTAFNCYHEQLGVPTIYEEYSPTWTLPWGGIIEERYGWFPNRDTVKAKAKPAA